MTKFDFKQWIINNKHGNKSKPLNEGFPDLTGDGEVTYADILKGRGVDLDYSKNEGEGMCEACGMAHEGECGMMDEDYGMMNEAPMSCFSYPAPYSSGQGCHTFSKCVNGVDDGNYEIYTTGMFANPDSFYLILCPNGCTTGDVLETTDNNGNIYKFIYGSDNQNQNVGGTNSNGDSIEINITGTANTSCVPPVIAPTFTECQTCCCKSKMQMEDVNKGINPTIDKVIKLIEQADRRREPSRDRGGRKANPALNLGGSDGKDYKFGPHTLPVGVAPPYDDGEVMDGPCASNHYQSNPFTVVGGYTPDNTNINPVTGYCPCSPSDSNNTFGNLTTNGYSNPNPGTPNNTNTSNGTGAC